MDGFGAELERLKEGGALRVLREVRHEGKYIAFAGRTMLDLSSNDYLGMGSDGGLWREFLEGYSRSGEFGGGACSSRLLTGNHPWYVSLERTLARLYGAQAALVFASGYHANTGILPAVASSKDIIFADKLVHASIIDGARLSRAKLVRYPHNDCAALEKLLERESYEKAFIVTESIFSMDGDTADLRTLVDIKKRHGAYLYVDEAHAIGVRSQRGLGLCDETGVTADVDFLVGTFGKAIASQGAFAITGTTMREYLINTMRTLIFSTALPPVSVAWTQFVMERIGSMNDRREHLKKISAMLGGESHIVPIMAGGNERAAELSEHLCRNGFFALPIRPPTVPPGSERVRISLNAAMTETEIIELKETCKRFGI